MAQKIITSALNYDQQSTPSNPARGQAWRERDSNNDIVETWFWNGTYWLTSEYLLSNFYSTVASCTSITYLTSPSFAKETNLLVTRVVDICRWNANGTVTFTLGYMLINSGYQDFYTNSYIYLPNATTPLSSVYYPNIVVPFTPGFRFGESSPTAQIARETLTIWGRGIRN